MKPIEKLALVILDGWGIGPDPKRSAIAQAKTPFYDDLLKGYPHAELITFGEDVGLPEGQMGNSEVGHMNIGAGRVVYQELVRINKAIRERELHHNPVLLHALQQAKAEGRAIHFMGLVSDGGVHSQTQHLLALCDIALEQGCSQVFIHAFMDGRDTSPNGGIGYLKEVLDHIEGKPVQLASIIGRYYAMDRDKRWERIKEAYDLLVHGQGTTTTNPLQAIQASYDAGVTDEFIKPHVLTNAEGKPIACIQPDDLVVCFNFRTDRCREISTVLTQENMPDFGMATLPLHYVTMTRYDERFKNVDVIFEKDDLVDTLGETLAKAGKTQLRIAETEKYPHVTFFFNGGREEPFQGEGRIMVPSAKVATYDLKPEMSAYEITDGAINYVLSHQPNFICLNYANTDMVGHTGVFSAAVKAAEAVDYCLERLMECLLGEGYSAIIIADHGNSDYMINDDGTPNTAHSMSPVPCIFVSDQADYAKVHNGKLGDLAPSILKLMGIAVPATMDGNKDLIEI
jgi:2,3-bisphosphoglycerate-independent phosphoglycerate mutase